MKALCVALCLIASVSGAQEEASRPERRRPAFTFQPVASLLVANRAVSLDDGLLFMLPLGMSVPLEDRGKQWELMLEFTPVYFKKFKRDAGLALALAVGATWFKDDAPIHQGFFLQPKLVGALSHDAYRTLTQGNPVAGQLTVGMDIGYRVLVPAGQLDFLVGGGVGWGWNVHAEAHSLFFPLLGYSVSDERTNKVVWDPNLHLLRIGLTL